MTDPASETGDLGHCGARRSWAADRDVAAKPLITAASSVLDAARPDPADEITPDPVWIKTP